MKSLARMIIVLVIINLTTGNFAPAQDAFSEGNAEPVEPVALSRARAPRRLEPMQPEAAPPAPIPEPLPEPEPVPTPTTAPSRMLTLSGRIGFSGGEVITGLSGVEMQGLPDNPVTDENGFYSATVPYGFSGTVRPVKKGYFFQPTTKSYQNITEKLYKCFTAIRIGPPPMFARTGSRKIIIIPATDIESEDLVAITEDLQVMSHIFDERFKEPQEIQGVFVDFGDIFGRDSRSTEAIYLQGYGALFLMEVNFTFSPEPEPQEHEVQETEEYIDPDWQRAKRKLFSPQGFGGNDVVPEEQYSEEQIEQIKTELIRTLKHAANIRNIQPDEWIILTVIGQSRQAGGMYEDYYRSAAPGSGTSRSRGRSSSSSRGSYGGGIGGGMGGGYGISGGMMMGGGMGGMAGGGMGGQAFGGGVMMGGGMGGMAGGGMGGQGFGGGMMGGMEYGETGSASTTVLTIRAKKSDVDDFAKGELDFEKFQQKVEIFTY